MKIQFEFVLRVEMETPRQNRRMTLRSTLSSFYPGDPASSPPPFHGITSIEKLTKVDPDLEDLSTTQQPGGSR